MQEVHQRLINLGILIPEIMFPEPGVDLQKWAIIACDQFTQDGSYWAEVERFVGDAPSTLNLIFPEIYISNPGKDERLLHIHQTMEIYLREGVFASPRQGLVYVERSTPYHKFRRGLVLGVDLEHYDWKRDIRPLIRTTEGTIEDRLPPRMAVRRGAALECSHVLLLIDDEEDTLVSGLGQRAKTNPPVYDTPLSAGAITGWFLDREADWIYLAEGLEALVRKALDRYGSPPFLYAVGDGNHSLASAKAIWEEYKSLHTGEPGLMNHPRRYALVEVENLYDPGICFEPIHRLLLGTDMSEVLPLLSRLPGFTSCSVKGPEALARLVEDGGAAQTRLGLITKGECMLIESDAQGLATDRLQPLLDDFIHSKGYGIDYIHGKDALLSGVHKQERPRVGILLPPIKKEGLFKTVANCGPLPRKSFSMGEAEEKRFYLECRKLF